MKKIGYFLIGIITLISLVLIVTRFFHDPIITFLNPPTKAGIKVLSTPEGAQVFLSGVEVGKTPYEDSNLNSGEVIIRVTSGDISWQGKVKLVGGTLAVVNRELSKSSSLGGEVLTLEKGLFAGRQGQGATVISSPSSSQVEIDGKVLGNTPLNTDLEIGDHTFAVYHEGYLKRSIKAYVPTQYNLNLNVDLSLSEDEVIVSPSPNPIATEIRLTVKSTPTGFLRVRDKPSLNGLEVERVSPGDKLVLLEELSGWDRVRLLDGKEGYVSAVYISKK